MVKSAFDGDEQLKGILKLLSFKYRVSGSLLVVLDNLLTQTLIHHIDSEYLLVGMVFNADGIYIYTDGRKPRET